MTVDELVAAAGQNMVGPGTPMTPERTAEALRMIMGMVLVNLDYERDPRSAPAIVCRALATVVHGIERLN